MPYIIHTYHILYYQWHSESALSTCKWISVYQTHCAHLVWLPPPQEVTLYRSPCFIHVSIEFVIDHDKEALYVNMTLCLYIHIWVGTMCSVHNVQLSVHTIEETFFGRSSSPASRHFLIVNVILFNATFHLCITGFVRYAHVIEKIHKCTVVCSYQDCVTVITYFLWNRMMTGCPTPSHFQLH